jgi:hypothetical protein
MDWEGASRAQDVLEARAIPSEEVRTQLTAYFEFNREREQSGQPPLGLTYATAYKKLRWNKTTKKWQLYKTSDESREGKKLNRIKGVSPIDFDLLVNI